MTAPRTLTIGLQRDYYPERRNISGSLSGARYVLARDEHPWVGRARRACTRALGRSANLIDREFTYRPKPRPGIDLFHVFNSVIFGSTPSSRRRISADTPWITTFETIIPRFGATLGCHHGPDPDFRPLQRDAHVREAVALLAGDSCAALLALSRCNLRMQQELLASFPDHRDAILAKLQHLAPPQPILLDQIDDKDWGTATEIRFVFVGAAFFRKGGREVLRVLEQLRETDPRIQLTVVSTLQPDDYVGRVDPAEVRATSFWLARLAPWVRHVPAMRNDEVLALMCRAHVGLLPTYADTYGYTVLEFQAAGCPVVTTDVRALTEINDDSHGWRIEVPKNHLGEALYGTEAERLALSRAIESGLEKAVHSLLVDPDSIRTKGERCLERVRRDHDPEAHGRALSAIYERALQRRSGNPLADSSE